MKTLIVLCIASSVLFSCAEGVGENRIWDISPEDPESAEEQEFRFQIADKVWSMVCMRNTMLNAYVIEEYLFKTSTVERRWRIFEQEGCEDYAGTVRIQGRYRLKVTEVDSRNAQFDFIVNHISALPETQAGVNILSQAQFCGQVQWNVNNQVVYTNVSGTNCPVQRLPQTLYGLMRVEDGELFLSRAYSTAAQNRPVATDRSRIFRAEN